MNKPLALRPVVSSAGTSNDIVAILGRLTEASPSDILAVRAIIEPEAAAAAVSSATRADIQAIREAHENALSQTDLDGFEKWDTEFHRLIYAATRNELLMSLHDILGVIRNRPSWLELKRKVFTEEKRRQYCEHHGRIAECIASRNAEGAAAAMSEHLAVIARNLFG